jgi:hypothetical protein
VFDVDEGTTLFYRRIDPKQAVVAVRAKPGSDQVRIAASQRYDSPTMAGLQLLVALAGGTTFLVDVENGSTIFFFKFDLDKKAEVRGLDYSGTGFFWVTVRRWLHVDRLNVSIGEHIVAVFSNRDLRIVDAEGMEIAVLQLTAVPTCLASRKCQDEDNQSTHSFAVYFPDIWL